MCNGSGPDENRQGGRDSLAYKAKHRMELAHENTAMAVETNRRPPLFLLLPLLETTMARYARCQPLPPPPPMKSRLKPGGIEAGWHWKRGY